eukprot:3932258-Rhodomonas_salina.3
MLVMPHVGTEDRVADTLDQYRTQRSRHGAAPQLRVAAPYHPPTATPYVISAPHKRIAPYAISVPHKRIARA